VGESEWWNAGELCLGNRLLGVFPDWYHTLEAFCCGWRDIRVIGMIFVVALASGFHVWFFFFPCFPSFLEFPLLKSFFIYI